MSKLVHLALFASPEILLLCTLLDFLVPLTSTKKAKQQNGIFVACADVSESSLKKSSPIIST